MDSIWCMSSISTPTCLQMPSPPPWTCFLKGSQRTTTIDTWTSSLSVRASGLWKIHMFVSWFCFCSSYSLNEFRFVLSLLLCVCVCQGCVCMGVYMCVCVYVCVFNSVPGQYAVCSLRGEVQIHEDRIRRQVLINIVVFLTWWNYCLDFHFLSWVAAMSCTQPSACTAWILSCRHKPCSASSLPYSSLSCSLVS